MLERDAKEAAGKLADYQNFLADKIAVVYDVIYRGIKLIFSFFKNRRKRGSNLSKLISQSL
jgi:hypothetical protein